MLGRSVLEPKDGWKEERCPVDEEWQSVGSRLVRLKGERNPDFLPMDFLFVPSVVGQLESNEQGS